MAQGETQAVQVPAMSIKFEEQTQFPDPFALLAGSTQLRQKVAEEHVEHGTWHEKHKDRSSNYPEGHVQIPFIKLKALQLVQFVKEVHASQ